MVKLRCVLSPILWPLQACRSKGCRAPPDFGRSVNPISTREVRLWPPHYYVLPKFSDLLTALRLHGSNTRLTFFWQNGRIHLSTKKGATFDIGIGLLRTCFSIKNIVLYYHFIELEVSYKTRDFQFNNFTHITSYFAPGPQFISNLWHNNTINKYQMFRRFLFAGQSIWIQHQKVYDPIISFTKNALETNPTILGIIFLKFSKDQRLQT